MNTEIIDKRGKIIDTRFSDIKVGEFFQDADEECLSYDDLICMKVSETSAIRFCENGNGRTLMENWGSLTNAPVIPLKATITVERGE